MLKVVWNKRGSGGVFIGGDLNTVPKRLILIF